MTYDEILEMADERHVELTYQGGIFADEDPYDYINVKEVIAHV